VLAETCRRIPVRILAYCVMPTHWHLVAWPTEDGQLSEFMFYLTRTHSLRWHGFRGMAGTGHLYQGRYKNFLVEDDGHMLTLCRYVERNALRAGLVQRAQDWKWGSLRYRGKDGLRKPGFLARWPGLLPADWVHYVNQPQSEAEIADLRESVMRSRPYGDSDWQSMVARKYKLEQSFRKPGRPTHSR